MDQLWEWMRNNLFRMMPYIFDLEQKEWTAKLKYNKSCLKHLFIDH